MGKEFDDKNGGYPSVENLPNGPDSAISSDGKPQTGEDLAMSMKPQLSLARNLIGAFIRNGRKAGAAAAQEHLQDGQAIACRDERGGLCLKSIDPITGATKTESLDRTL